MMTDDLSIWNVDERDFPPYEEWKDLVEALDMLLPEIEGWIDACKKEAWVLERLARYENHDRNIAVCHYFWFKVDVLVKYKKQLEADLDAEKEQS